MNSTMNNDHLSLSYITYIRENALYRLGVCRKCLLPPYILKNTLKTSAVYSVYVKKVAFRSKNTYFYLNLILIQ